MFTSNPQVSGYVDVGSTPNLSASFQEPALARHVLPRHLYLTSSSEVRLDSDHIGPPIPLVDAFPQDPDWLVEHASTGLLCSVALPGVRANFRRIVL